MDRDAHVRAARRRQALDALTFEQDREAMLVEQLEDVLAEAEGQRLDDAVFARLDPDDAGLVRGALGLDMGVEPDEAEPGDDFGLPLEFDLVGADPETEADGLEAEMARLQEEIGSSRRVQVALGRYLELLSAGPSPP